MRNWRNGRVKWQHINSHSPLESWRNGTVKWQHIDQSVFEMRIERSANSQPDVTAVTTQPEPFNSIFITRYYNGDSNLCVRRVKIDAPLRQQFGPSRQTPCVALSLRQRLSTFAMSSILGCQKNPRRLTSSTIPEPSATPQRSLHIAN